MLFRETVTVYCENHTEHINTLCGQNAEFVNVKASGMYSYRCTVMYWISENARYSRLYKGLRRGVQSFACHLRRGGGMNNCKGWGYRASHYCIAWLTGNDACYNVASSLVINHKVRQVCSFDLLPVICYFHWIHRLLYIAMRWFGNARSLHVCIESPY
jgi:hypothetical protein